MENITWPQKTREFHNHHFDSTAWNDFKFRDDDIIIATYAKSGTTWMQQIVAQLVFDGAEGLPVAEMSPWLDLRVPPTPVKLQGLESQNHRRFIKTHLPVDALVFSPEAKYIFVGRDGRDILWSLYNHHTQANEKWYGALNETPGLVGPKMPYPGDDVVEYFREWLDRDGYPFWSMWEVIKSWWDIRDLPNVYFAHFADLKKDLPGEIQKVAAFLEIPINDDSWNDIVDHCSFTYMKANAPMSVPLGGALWKRGADSFIHKGTNGRWRDMLTSEDIARYDRIAMERLGSDCANWLATGEMPA